MKLNNNVYSDVRSKIHHLFKAHMQEGALGGTIESGRGGTCAMMLTLAGGGEYIVPTFCTDQGSYAIEWMRKLRAVAHVWLCADDDGGVAGGYECAVHHRQLNPTSSSLLYDIIIHNWLFTKLRFNIHIS